MKTLEPHQIEEVEKVLGFKLYDYQRAVLLGESYTLPHGRRSGKTLCHQLKQLLLSDRIELTPRSYISDFDYHGVLPLKYEHWYRRELEDLHKKLENNGIQVARIIDKTGW